MSKFIPALLFKNICDSVPLAGVDILVLDPENRVLLLKRNNQPAKGLWWFPGGRILLKETRIQAVRRKLEEECSLEAETIEECGTFDTIFSEEVGGASCHQVSTLYLARVATNTVVVDNQTLEYRWAAPRKWLTESLPTFVNDSISKWADLNG
ncbi:MAG: NUDIX domain-containing protein [Candidatus Lindowbacteria bacterium]|nr:NUDIX domain-containing protein [Candidatus Lindowbacteria bacterium]